MQRTIKFRGKRVDNGEWVYGDLYTFQKVRIRGNDGHYWEFEVIPETVGQFTGLTDMNGKEIYEGDVVDIYGMGRYVVVFKEGCFGAIDHDGFSPFRSSIWGTGGEIIGNIYDNPELLGGNK